MSVRAYVGGSCSLRKKGNSAYCLAVRDFIESVFRGEEVVYEEQAGFPTSREELLGNASAVAFAQPMLILPMYGMPQGGYISPTVTQLYVRTQSLRSQSLAVWLVENLYPFQWQVWTMYILLIMLLCTGKRVSAKAGFWLEMTLTSMFILYGSFLKATISSAVLPEAEALFENAAELIKLIASRQMTMINMPDSVLMKNLLQYNSDLAYALDRNPAIEARDSVPQTCQLALNTPNSFIIAYEPTFDNWCDMSCFTKMPSVLAELLLPIAKVFDADNWLIMSIVDRDPVPVKKLKYREMLSDFLRTAFFYDERKMHLPNSRCKSHISNEIAKERTGSHIYAATMTIGGLFLLSFVVVLVEYSIHRTSHYRSVALRF